MAKFTYEQFTGFFRKDGTYLWQGYSGHDEGLNNPSLEWEPNVGPIPKGEYVFGKPEDHPDLGPYAVPIIPKPETDTHGRAGFYLHGDNKEANHTASHGCIIKSPKLQRQVVVEGDELTVV